MKLSWTPRALRNLADISSYLAENSPSAANELLTRIRLRATSLPDLPLQGRAGRQPETRELTAYGTKYILVYRLRADLIEILAVIHTARRWPASL